MYDMPEDANAASDDRFSLRPAWQHREKNACHKVTN
jgi:hypothetical protein